MPRWMFYKKSTMNYFLYPQIKRQTLLATIENVEKALDDDELLYPFIDHRNEELIFVKNSEHKSATVSVE